MSDQIGQQTTGLGQPFPFPLQVIATNDSGQPVAGASVHFALAQPTNPAAATLSSTDVVTNSSGVASVTATANNTAGLFGIFATNAGAPNPAIFALMNLPVGYRPGQQLADFTAVDQAGVSRSIRSFLDGGTSYLLIDVCAMWCLPCRDVQQNAAPATAELAASALKLHVVPLLWQNTQGAPTNQTNAATWRDTFSLQEPVLHASGSNASAMYKSSQLYVGSEPGAGTPTSLLVAPDGTIIDRLVSIAHLTQDEIVRRVGDHFWLPATHTMAASQAGFRVVVGTASMTGTLLPGVEMSAALGRALFRDEVHARSLADIRDSLSFEFRAAAPLPSTGELSVTITPTWPDGHPRLLAATVLEDARPISQKFGAEFIPPLDGPLPPTIVPPVQIGFSGGILKATFDLAGMQSRWRENVQNAFNLAQITAEQRDELIANLRGFTFTVPLTIDVVAPPPPVLKALPASPANNNNPIVRGGAEAGSRITLYRTANCTGTTATFTEAVLESGFGFVVGDDTTTTLSATATDASGNVSKCTKALVYIEDSTPPVVVRRSDVVVETKAASATVVYTNPAAADSLDGATAVTCTPPSGSSFANGSNTPVTCTSQDRAKNTGSNSFNIIVQLPTTTGAVTNPGDTTVPLGSVAHSRRVRVSAGGFVPGSTVAIRFFDSDADEFAIGTAPVGDDGRFDARVKIPHEATPGPGEVIALGHSAGDGSEIERIWAVTVRPE
ncbi:MAG TPA: Ig-like domain-containing protein [Candidatus Limnocylindrales bacterium]|nr:Ig-like domain-containing protein [Candidatus Limnocylindrales bacterium]